jgi:catalase
MKPAQPDPTTTIAEDILQAFDALSGPHPGFRPVHAKGVLLAGKFTPAPGAEQLTRAPHIQRSSTPVSVRFSDFAGVPGIPDNDPNASPRGFAIRFHLAEHVHTDIIAHSVDGFPVRTAEEFRDFLRAAAASGPDAPKPTPIESFLASHPAALAFVQTPKPFPVSFAADSYFGVAAFKFVNREGLETYGRFRIRPEGQAEYLDDAAAAKKSPNYLFEEIEQRVSRGGIRMRITVQLAAPGDTVNDSTVHWPKDRREVDFGTVELSGIVPNNEAEQRHIIFDPIPRVDGIDTSDDPLLDVRSTLYLMSGRRRRAQGSK